MQSPHRRSWRHISVPIAMLLLCSLRTLAAEQRDESPLGAPYIAAVVVELPPVVDGLLDDACWQAATHMDGFWREDVDAPELERTEAWICADSASLYVAFRCHDSRPSEIRADQTKRQGSLRNDDRVAVGIDVEDTGRSMYEFRVNPVGTQQDHVPGGTSEKIEWRG
ncbi:MAG: hypothetical protein GTN78_02640, partial [Gemmatimonadales bacterium]|nr:hypothetical protein [Gemmatimonadales bacterium]